MNENDNGDAENISSNENSKEGRYEMKRTCDDEVEKATDLNMADKSQC